MSDIIIKPPESSISGVRPNKKSNISVSEVPTSNLDSHVNQDNLTPHSAASVDQIQEWKTWLSENNGHILAAMLQRLPSPVTRKISWGEFVSLFDLNFDPSEDVAKQIENITTTFPEWIRKFNFSYMALANATARINADPQNFNSKLSAIAEKLNNSSASQSSDENFRKLFV